MISREKPFSAPIIRACKIWPLIDNKKAGRRPIADNKVRKSEDRLHEGYVKLG